MVRLKFLKSVPSLIAASVVLAVCLLEIFPLGLFQRLEWITYDVRVRAAENYSDTSKNAKNLGFVQISDETIRSLNNGSLGFNYGLYWPRHIYGRILQELSAQKAKAVAFDVMFAERRPDHDSVPTANGSVISSDEYFANELDHSGNVILAADQDVMPDPLFQTKAWAVGNITVQRDADGVLRRDQAFKDYRVWHRFIQQAAADPKLGFNLEKTKIEPHKIILFLRRHGSLPGDESVTIPLNDAGMIETTTFDANPPRTAPKFFYPYRTVRVWSMGIVMAAYELKLDLENALIQPEQHRIVLRGDNGIERVIPIDRDGNFPIEWSLRLNDVSVAKGSVEELLQAQIERAAGKQTSDWWTNKLILIGSTAVGNDLTDMGTTPLEQNTFLASKHLNVANSIITGRFVTTSPRAFNLFLIALIGAFSAWITWTLRPLTGSLLIVLFAIAYYGLALLVYVQFRFWLPIILPIICAGLMTHICTVSYRVFVEQTEKKRVKSIFSKIVAPDVVNELLGAEKVSLGGVRRHVTIYFADIRGFTEMTDLTQARAEEHVREYKLNGAAAEAYFDEQAAETFSTVSLYLGTIAETIIRQKGTLDKYIGDCVMAFWGAPIHNEQHALACVGAAIESQRAIFALNQQRAAENKQREQENFSRTKNGLPPLPLLPVLALGSGINSGVTVVGLMGSDTHGLNYTVLGREVNLAARLEGVSGRGRIIIGEATYSDIKRDDPKLAATCIELPPVAVKGFRNAVKIYEVPWQPAALSVTPEEKRIGSMPAAHDATIN